jgi:DnaK suppressor protein
VNASRHEELRTMLEGRRVAGQNEMQGRMRTIRGDGATSVDRRVPDDLEGAIQEDIDLALLQINAEIVDKITDALARLEAHSYGACNECGEDIAEKRLRALPFAARCKTCQEAFEANERSHRAMERRSANLRFMGSLERYGS